MGENAPGLPDSWLNNLEKMTTQESESAKHESRCPRCACQTLTDTLELNTLIVKQCLNCLTLVFVDKEDRRLSD